MITADDIDREQQIEIAYQALCRAKTKPAKTRAWSRLHELITQRSGQQIAVMEDRRMAAIRGGG